MSALLCLASLIIPEAEAANLIPWDDASRFRRLRRIRQAAAYRAARIQDPEAWAVRDAADLTILAMDARVDGYTDRALQYEAQRDALLAGLGV